MTLRVIMQAYPESSVNTGRAGCFPWPSTSLRRTPSGALMSSEKTPEKKGANHTENKGGDGSEHPHQIERKNDALNGLTNTEKNMRPPSNVRMVRCSQKTVKRGKNRNQIENHYVGDGSGQDADEENGQREQSRKQ